MVERCFNRFDSSARSPPATPARDLLPSEIIIAAIVSWLRADLQDTP